MSVSLPRVACFLVAALLLPVNSAVAQAPSTLTGEFLQSNSVLHPDSDVTTQCGPNGQITFTASGVAQGPYPGTFDAQGTFVASNPNSIDSFSETFTIHSGSTTVSGTKTLDTQTQPGEVIPGLGTASFGGTCQDFTLNVLGQLQYQAGAATVARYEATIDTGNGTYRDRGRSIVSVSELIRKDPSSGEILLDGEDFGQLFLSDLSEPEQALPTSAEQCKKGGWKQYGIFKNQGDCVSFVATNGKNPPAGGS